MIFTDTIISLVNKLKSYSIIRKKANSVEVPPSSGRMTKLMSLHSVIRGVIIF